MKQPMPQNGQYGILLLNMGGPSCREDIPGYLFRLFSDPRIIGLPNPFKRSLARLLSAARSSKVVLRYGMIGGGSPILAETRKQAESLEELLSLPVACGMRYTIPSVGEAVQTLDKRGISKLILLPLYPQFSLMTSQSSLDDFVKTGNWKRPFRVIPHHFDHPFFIEAHTEMLAKILGSGPASIKTAVLFVAHSIPIRRIKQGDPYVDQVKATISLISQNINLPFILKSAYQSHVGPIKWQGPSLKEALEEISRERIGKIIVHPLSFASENLETLYDLDIEFKKKCIDRGLEFLRVPAPGIHPKYIQALASLVKEEIHRWEMEHV